MNKPTNLSTGILLLFITAVSCCPPFCKNRDKENMISPPIVNPPLYQCATAVTVQGFVPGATITIYANGSTQIGTGTSDTPWGQSFPVAPDLVAGQKITATQTYNGITSQPSQPVDVVDYFQLHPEGLTKPVQKLPIYNCGGALSVSNLVEGGQLNVFADGNQVGTANGCGAGQWLFISPNFVTGQKVFSHEILCSVKGPKSDEATVQINPSSLPVLTVGDVYENGKYVNVYNITNGALVSVFNGPQQIAGHFCSGGGQVFRLSPVPVPGDQLTAVQKLCDVTSVPSDPVVVRSCKELPAPVVLSVCIEDQFIHVTGTAPDAIIRVYQNGNLIAFGGGNKIVPFASLIMGASITATQALDSCVSPLSAPVTVKQNSLPVYDPNAWNNPSWVRCNNCYNYGCDIRTDNFAQPGYAHGVFPNVNCPDEGNAAKADGLTESLEKRCPGCTHIVALVIDPDYPDYHWYRLDDNGMWSHKPGGTNARNTDASNNPISNPETADRRSDGPDYTLNYRIFCGYYCVDKDIVVIQGPRDCE